MKKFVIIIALLSYGCALTGNVISNFPNELTRETEIYFCPQDNCSSQLIRMIRNSTQVDCALYQLNIKGVIQALEEKNARVVIDGDNRIKSSLAARYDTKHQLMHNKFCIFDRKKILTGSFNPTTSGDKSYNNLVVLYSNHITKNYESEFEELWDGIYSDGKKVENPVVQLNNAIYENYFCPEDCERATERIIQMMDNSRVSIEFMQFSFTHDGIGQKLIERHKEGIKVSGVFEKGGMDSYSEYEKLKKAGVNVMVEDSKALMHNKVFIIDRKIVITGSWNPTRSGTEKNDENILIITDEKIAGQYSAEFRKINKLKVVQ